uniref:basic leucine zipper transcriptional factor ATF-like 3 isoform X2 n=1 Tax=Scatophagus argus TaxID=75038 RepID=UPI001ED86129|nr:basic leucine zipper transcriptional factor ATF-like 3 isoform X2 [Scatophagus argus]
MKNGRKAEVKLLPVFCVVCFNFTGLSVQSTNDTFYVLTEQVCRIFSCFSAVNACFERSVMSDCDSYYPSHQRICENKLLCEGCEGSEDGDRRLKRREKNRVAAQKSRKRQTQRADLLHAACELLEQRNRKLKREVDSLFEEQRLLNEALRAHEPFCPIMHCSFASSTSSSLQPDAVAARSV